MTVTVVIIDPLHVGHAHSRLSVVIRWLNEKPNDKQNIGFQRKN